VATSRCFSQKVAPTTNGEIAGTYPYLNLDSTADGSSVSGDQGAVAFITIPPQMGTAGYRLCYKPQASNWIDQIQKNNWNAAPNGFLVGKRPTFTFSLGGPAGRVLSNSDDPSNGVWVGSYAYIAIIGGTINLDTDLVKLVLAVNNCCDRPASRLL